MHTLEVPNNPVFIKTSTAVIGGAVMTFAAFAFMQYLISGEQRAPVKPGGDIIVEIFQAPEDSKVRHIQKIQPPPPMPKVPQKAPPLDTSADPVLAISDFTPVTIDDFGGDINNTINRPTGDATPSCNDEVLVQIKHSLLSDLKGKHAVESGLNTGNMLAMAHNGKGQIIALKHAGAGVRQCGA